MQSVNVVPAMKICPLWVVDICAGLLGSGIQGQGCQVFWKLSIWFCSVIIFLCSLSPSFLMVLRGTICEGPSQEASLDVHLGPWGFLFKC